MKRRIKDILYTGLLLAGILSMAMVLNHFFGAVVAGIYAVISLTAFACFLYEIRRAPVMDDEPSDENK